MSLLLGCFMMFLSMNPVSASEDPSNIDIQAIPVELTYPGTSIKVKAGDVLYSSKSLDTKIVGHIGIVDDTGYVVHMVPGGMKRQNISQYSSSFNYRVFGAKSTTAGYNASRQAKYIWNNYSNAKYNVATMLGGARTTQYCTKLVWQSYFYSPDRINLNYLPLTGLSVPPERLLDTYHLTFKATIL